MSLIVHDAGELRVVDMSFELNYSSVADNCPIESVCNIRVFSESSRSKVT
jgi:hypothetical protein